MFLTVMTAIGLFVLRIAIARPLRAARRGDEPARRLDRLRGRLGRSGCSRSRSTSTSRPRSTRCGRTSRRGDARAALPGDRVRARLRRHGDLLRALLRRRLDRALGRPPRARAPLDRRVLAATSGALARRGGRARHPRHVPAMRRQTVAARARRCCSTGCTSSPGRSGSAAWSACCSSGPPCPRVEPRRRRSRSPCRASRTSRSSRSLVLLASGIRRDHHPHADLSRALADVVRPGDPRQDRRCSPTAMLLAAVNLLRTKPRLDAARERPELGPPAATLLRRLVTGEARDRRVRRLRGGPPLEPRAAREGARGGGVGARARRPRQGRSAVVQQNGYTLKMLVSPNKAAAPNTLRAPDHEGTAGRLRGADVTLTFAMLDMQMANQEYQLDRDAPGHLLAPGTGARDGRPLGPHFTRSRPRAASRSPSSSSTTPPDESESTPNTTRSIQIRLFAALVALGAGVTAAIIAILVIHTVLG